MAKGTTCNECTTRRRAVRDGYNAYSAFEYGCEALLGDPKETQALFLRPSIVMKNVKVNMEHDIWDDIIMSRHHKRRQSPPDRNGAQPGAKQP